MTGYGSSVTVSPGMRKQFKRSLSDFGVDQRNVWVMSLCIRFLNMQFNIIFFLSLVCRCGTVVFMVIRIFLACWNDDGWFYVDQFENKASEMMLWISCWNTVLGRNQCFCSLHAPEVLNCSDHVPHSKLDFFFNSIFSSGAHSYWTQRWMWIFVMQFMI